MTQKVLKFGSADLFKFIEIYRSHDCLWDTENVNYKNRDARNAALVAFAQEFGVEGYGPKEITNKIKILRTQYHGERKKIRDSMCADSGTADVYKSKLFWYNLMDSFLKKTSEHRDSNSSFNVSFPKKAIKIPPGYLHPASNPLECIEKRSRLEKHDDDIDNFGKYVASTLRTLNYEYSVHAQDEIQSVLSKFKLLNLKENERKNSTPVPEFLSKQESEDTW